MDNEQILDNAFEQLRAEQEQELVIDFDQAKRKVKPITVRYGKEMYRSKVWYLICYIISWVYSKPLEDCYKPKEYKIPGETPQWYMNIISRKLHEVRSLKFEELTEEELIEKLEIDDKHNEMIYRKLFGDEFVDRYLDDNFVSMSTLNDELLNPILVKWGWKPATDTTQKKSLKNAS